MRWIKVLVLGVLSAAGCVTVRAQSLCCEDGVFRWEGNMTAGLNNDGYEINFGAAYFPIQYIGFKASLGVAGEIEQMGDWGEDEWETGHHYASRFKFNPAVVLRSPRVANIESQGCGFYVFAEPGFVLSPGASGSRHPEWLRWDVKAGINMQIGRCVFTFGYGVSNFSLYSGSPDNMQGLPERDNYITHNVFLGCGYKF